MVDANTFDDGSGMKRFQTRAQMYDHMVENGHAFTEESGDEGLKFKAHLEKRLLKNPNDSKAKALKEKHFAD